jgi:hypothetical protein
MTGNLINMVNDEQLEKPDGADFRLSLAGRDIWFRKITEAQRIILSRIEKRVQRDINDLHNSNKSFEEKLSGVQEHLDYLYQRMWDVIDTRVVIPADRDFLEKSMLAGKLEFHEALTVFRQGKPAPEPDDAAPAPPVKKAARPRKAAQPRKPRGQQ